jgi:hypothetical protein
MTFMFGSETFYIAVRTRRDWLEYTIQIDFQWKNFRFLPLCLPQQSSRALDPSPHFPSFEIEEFYKRYLATKKNAKKKSP